MSATVSVTCQGILLDIEGTTSSVRYVYDVLFPFARRQVDSFLTQSWNGSPTCRACDLIARDTGAGSLEEWTRGLSEAQSREKVRAEVLRLMDGDVKATGLKELQGLIWQRGYDSGELGSHVYPDVPPALKRWADAGRDIRIYSSGSVAAQKVFFAHTSAGDLSRCLRGHYDTTTGPKRETPSYTRIAAAMNRPPAQIVFVSDVVAELDAARAAGMQTVLSLRPENAPVAAGHTHPSVTSFDQIHIG
jgi:enolase-phosphatase E1